MERGKWESYKGSLRNIKADKLSEGAGTGKQDLRLLVTRNIYDSVQRNGVPHELDACVVPFLAAFFAEQVAGCIGAVDFEDLVR